MSLTQRSLARRGVLWLGLVFALSPVPRAHADQVTLRPSSDTTLYEDEPANGNGAGASLVVGIATDGSERRSLLRFDVARSVPEGATITGAVLTLACTACTRASTIELHRALSAWQEGASQATVAQSRGTHASEHDATWSHRSWPSLEWQKPGGDYARGASADTVVEGPGAYAWTARALALDAQGFLDRPQANFGWVLIADREPVASVAAFDSREASVETGPTLVITYEPPAPPTGACCFVDGGCGVQLDAARACSGKYLGTNSLCGPGACDWPTGACCALDASASCDERKSEACGVGSSWRGAGSSCAPNPCAAVLTPFVDPLPLLAVARPIEGEAGGEASYRMRIVQRMQKLHRDLPPTKVWGFADDDGEGSYPGPTIEARAGSPVRVTWANDLRDAKDMPLVAHQLAVDVCLDGVGDGLPRTVIHLHGGHLAATSDGQPDEAQLPGEEAHYDYPNAQRAATLWYHDQTLGNSRLNATMGLSGLYLLRDDEEDALELPKGKHEVPLVLQDRSVDASGTLLYPTYWQQSVFGDQPVVNGKISPYLEVDRGAYRFRVVNASTSRTYTLSLSNDRAFELIGTDGGLLEEAQSIHALTLMPGERADVIVDFEYAGDEVYLLNGAATPFPFGGAAAPIAKILKLIVGDAPGHTAPIPTRLSELERLDPKEAVLQREIVLARTGSDECSEGGAFGIDDRSWATVTERPALGTTEIWRFSNRSPIALPMHVHGLSFQVLDRQEIAVGSGALKSLGEPRPPERTEAGWKDTVRVGPFEAARVIARFDHAGRYPYQCQLAELADHAMMRRFEVQPVCGDGARSEGEACDDGNTHDGDGCDRRCRRERDPGPLDGAIQDDDAGIATRSDGGGCSVISARLAHRATRTAALVPWLLALWCARSRRRAAVRRAGQRRDPLHTAQPRSSSSETARLSAFCCSSVSLSKWTPQRPPSRP